MTVAVQRDDHVQLASYLLIGQGARVELISPLYLHSCFLDVSWSVDLRSRPLLQKCLYKSMHI